MVLFLFFFASFTSMLVSIPDKATHFLDVFGVGCGVGDPW